MDNSVSQDYFQDLARVRIERAEELIQTAENELEREDYRSANNRAFYAMEKAVNALLATKGASANTHSGVLKTFNRYFIYEGDGSFDHDDYRMIQEAETIRQASDYDDFYIVKKEDCIRQVENAKEIVKKVRLFLSKKNDWNNID